MKKSLFLLLVMSVFLMGCAVGPLVSHEPARTVGDGHHDLTAGYGVAGYVLKWNYGVSENFDIGLHWESLSIGLRTKYAFINNQSGGVSLAAALGTGASVGGSHRYADIMVSHLDGRFEPYGTLRLVHVSTDRTELEDEDTGEVLFEVDKDEYQYGQVILGSRIWINERWYGSLELSTLFSMSDELDIEDGNVLVGAAFGYRF